MRLNKDDQPLTGPQMQEFQGALRDAFRQDSFKQLLRLQLDQKLEDLTSLNTPFPTQLTDVIEKADEEGWTAELLHAARMWRPERLKLLNFAQRFGLAPAVLSPNVFESKIRPHLKDIDVFPWIARLSQIAAQVCYIEIDGIAAVECGTGFLVGPDTIITSFHVMEKVIKGQLAPERVSLYFDYKALEDGQTTSKRPQYHLRQQWMLDASPYSLLDYCDDPSGHTPTEEELDYVLLGVDGRPGLEHVFGEENKNPQACKRGWITPPLSPPQLHPGMEVFILHHPDGERLKLTLDTHSILNVNENQTRVRYQTNTTYGTSGAPCFNLNWELIALHHTGDPNAQLNYPATFNQGIPFSTILRRLEQQKIPLRSTLSPNRENNIKQVLQQVYTALANAQQCLNSLAALFEETKNKNLSTEQFRAGLDIFKMMKLYMQEITILLEQSHDLPFELQPKVGSVKHQINIINGQIDNDLVPLFYQHIQGNLTPLTHALSEIDCFFSKEEQ